MQIGLQSHYTKSSGNFPTYISIIIIIIIIIIISGSSSSSSSSIITGYLKLKE